MKGYRIAAMAVIGVLCCNTMAFAAPKPLEEAYEKNGNSYIKKTYVINNTEEIFDTMDTTFELNGLVYHQIDISSKPVAEVLTKDVKQTEETTDYSELYQAVSELKEELKLPVILYYAEDFSIKEIAEILEITEGAVQKRLARARGKLKKAFEHKEVFV